MQTRQTIIRMSESLYQQLKRKAKQQNVSLNSIMNKALLDSIATQAGKLNPEDYKPSEKLKGLGKILSGATEIRESLDPRANYLLSK